MEVQSCFLVGSTDVLRTGFKLLVLQAEGDVEVLEQQCLPLDVGFGLLLTLVSVLGLVHAFI